MANFLRIFAAAILVATFIPSRAPGQSRESAALTDRFEFFEGHAYMGGDTVKWDHDKLVVVKRVADMTGKGSFRETSEQLTPTRQAWQQFWERVESLGVWQWKPDYSDAKRAMPDGESWVLELQHGGRQLKSKGYNAVPDAYGKFREAVHKLVEDARHQEHE